MPLSRRMNRPTLVVLAVLALSACSSDGPAGGAGDDAPATTAGAGVGADGGTTVPAGSVTAPAVQSPEAMFEYYQKLGVAEPVIDCYLEALADLGVTSLNQLEDDQALGAEAADRFDGCVAELGTATTTG